MKLQTLVDCGNSLVGISLGDKILVLGSCFADGIGQKLIESGFDALVNPFGTLYNPESVFSALERLSSGKAFVASDCEPMGAGAGLICSFHHHTSFARSTESEFLENANDSLSKACDFFKSCNKVIITLGTAFCFKYLKSGEVVANCLKRPAGEFERYRLSQERIVELLRTMVEANPDKKFIFTVSPVRHMADTAHGNQLSKSLLLLSESEICESYADRCEYFPAYEILLDELRDYRFYAEDMVHPSAQAIRYIWEKFIDFAVPAPERERLLQNEKIYRQSQHRTMLR